MPVVVVPEQEDLVQPEPEVQLEASQAVEPVVVVPESALGVLEVLVVEYQAQGEFLKALSMGRQ